MNARQLDAFRKVMETGSVSQAAAHMRLSQPAVSKLIASLEETIGFALFRRERQRLVPTAEGKVFFDETRIVLTNLARLEQVARGLRSAEVGHIVVAAAPVIGLSLMPAILNAFQVSRPGVTVSLQITSSLKILELATTQQVDVAIGLLASDDPGVACETLYRGGWVCVLPPGHRLAGRSIVTAADLAGEPFISLGEADRTRHVVDTVFDRAGVSRVLMTSTELGMAACEFVRLGAGVTLLDPITAYARANRDLVVKPFYDPPPFDLKLLLPRSRDPSHLRAIFLDHLKAEMDRWSEAVGDPGRAAGITAPRP